MQALQVGAKRREKKNHVLLPEELRSRQSPGCCKHRLVKNRSLICSRSTQNSKYSASCRSSALLPSPAHSHLLSTRNPQLGLTSQCILPSLLKQHAILTRMCNRRSSLGPVFRTQLGAPCIHCSWHLTTHTRASESVQLNKEEKHYLGAYVLANSAASGARPVLTSKSTHARVSPSSKNAVNATLFAPVFSTRSPSAVSASVARQHGKTHRQQQQPVRVRSYLP